MVGGRQSHYPAPPSVYPVRTFFFLVCIVKINIAVDGKERAVCRLIPRDLQSVRCEIAFSLQWLQSWSCILPTNFGFIYIRHALLHFMVSFKGTELIKAAIMNSRCSLPSKLLVQVNSVPESDSPNPLHRILFILLPL